jgi:uncharacterized protein (TIGR00255 family)
MIKSMTGFGRFTGDKNGISIVVEVRSLNSKLLDLSLRMPKSFSEKELEIRNMINQMLERGKVSINVDVQRIGSSNASIQINKDLFQTYYRDLKDLSQLVGDEGSDIFRMAIQMPEVIISNTEQGDDEETWTFFLDAIKSAIQDCDNFRIKEGAVLGESFKAHIDRIRKALHAVAERDPMRIEEVRNRLRQAFQEWELSDQMDKNRFEQELLYYVDKFDINEEKVRLTNHLDHFLEALDSPTSQGKKLNFISQEMGREINTIGSKSYDAQIQRSVIAMKDELEQIKEQLSNIL